MGIESIANTSMWLDIDKAEGWPHNISGFPTSEEGISNDRMDISTENFEGKEYVRFQFCSEGSGAYGNAEAKADKERILEQIYNSDLYKSINTAVPITPIFKPLLNHLVEEGIDLACSPRAIYYSSADNELFVTEAKKFGLKNVPQELGGKRFPELADDRLHINVASALSFFGWNIAKSGETDEANDIFNLAHEIYGKKSVPHQFTENNFVFPSTTVDIDDNVKTGHLPSLGCVSVFARGTANDRVINFEGINRAQCFQSDSELNNLLGKYSKLQSAGKTAEYSPWAVCLESAGNTVFAIEAPSAGANQITSQAMPAFQRYKIHEARRAYLLVLGALECQLYNAWEETGTLDGKKLAYIKEASQRADKVVSRGTKLPQYLEISNRSRYSYNPPKIEKTPFYIKYRYKPF